MISVLIPSYKRPELLKRALGSLLESSALENEIIVLTPQPGEEYRRICESAQATIVDDGSRQNGKRVKGLWQVLNEGIDMARSPFVCWLNDDCTVLKGWDSIAVSYFEQKDCALVSMRTRPCST